MKFTNLSKIGILIILLNSIVLANDRLSFPFDYKNGVMYEQVKRSNVIEDIYAPKTAISSLQKDGKLPDNTVITMEEYANENGQKGKLNRIIIMKKTGQDWQFDSFDNNGNLNHSENPNRCYSCHKDSVVGEDIVFTLNKIKNFKLGTHNEIHKYGAN